MSEITLSKAVRSNLLNLQSTADLLGKSQERLSTGLRVNSALDNPTNFFTAQGLNSRANDLSQLLDSVSNAVQTVAAADKGITAITKLVESAQATARQALQTSATIDSAGTATAGSVTAGSFTTLNVSGAGSSATHGSVGAANALTTINLTGTPAGNASLGASSALSSIDLTGTPATNASLGAASALTTIDLSDTPATNATVSATSDVGVAGDLDASGGDITFEINGTTVTLSQTGGSGGDGHYSLDDVVDEINNTVGIDVLAENDSGHLKLTSTNAAGLSDTITIDTFSSGDEGQLGFATSTGSVTASGTDLVPTADLTFDVNGQTVTLAGGSSYDGNAIASAITTQVGVSAKVSASYTSGKLVVTSTDTAGTSDDVTIDNFSSGDEGQLGFSTSTGSVTASGGAAAPAADITFDVNGQTVTLAGGSTYDGTAIASAITTQVGVSAKVSASYTSGKLVVTSTDTAGTSDDVTIDNFSAGNETQLGFSTTTGSVTASGTAANPAADITFDVNGQTVTLAGGSSYDGTAIASAITTQVGVSAKVSASYTSGKLVVTSTDTAGASDDVTIDNFSAGNETQLGFTTTTGTVTGSGADATSADAVSFSLSVNGTAHAISISAASVATYNGTHSSATINAASLSANDVASLINDQAGGSYASVTTGGALKFTSSTTGTGSTVAITGLASSTTAGSTGVANNSGTGSASSSTPIANPKRAELVDTYNDLLGQIDALAKDSGFNGVNLLNGDNLSVLFNEDGTSSLSIAGISDDAHGLGLDPIATTAFDTNTSINSTLDDLKNAIETLRGQSAKFGSNLSVVETRQDFTKNMINVLQTGASNLTLADTNEEAANVLALQTRQQLSSTALSLASQADQNVLRLF